MFTGEVIAVVGPSGSGKTTLLHAITGIAPADYGEVVFDGQPFHRLLAADQSIVGIVPQDDVVHPELTVEESLWYGARLRFPRDVSQRAVQVEVERVLAELDITHIRPASATPCAAGFGRSAQARQPRPGAAHARRTACCSSTSPRRASIRTRPRTSCRSSASSPTAAASCSSSPTTRRRRSSRSVDHLLVLAPGGTRRVVRPARRGRELVRRRVGRRDLREAAGRLATEWRDRYRDGAAYRKYVRTREHLLGLDGARPASGAERIHVQRSLFRQYRTLASRTFLTKRRDWLGVAVLERPGADPRPVHVGGVPGARPARDVHALVVVVVVRRRRRRCASSSPTARSGGARRVSVSARCRTWPRR